MKKTLLFTAFAVVCAALTIAASEVSFAQSKAATKEAKKAAKELKKQGWYIDGNHSMEYCLAKFMELEEENETFIGRSSNYDNEKVAKNAARRDGVRESIELTSSQFRGIGDEMEGKLNNETLDNLVMASINKYEGKIEGKMRVSFVLFKKNPNNKYDAQVYMYLQKQVANEYKKEAMIDGLKETAIAETYINEIERIVNEKFK